MTTTEIAGGRLLGAPKGPADFFLDLGLFTVSVAAKAEPIASGALTRGKTVIREPPMECKGRPNALDAWPAGVHMANSSTAMLEQRLSLCGGRPPIIPHKAALSKRQC